MSAKGDDELKLKALIVEKLDVDILGGVPFTDTNGISVEHLSTRCV